MCLYMGDQTSIRFVGLAVFNRKAATDHKGQSYASLQEGKAQHSGKMQKAKRCHRASKT